MAGCTEFHTETGLRTAQASLSVGICTSSPLLTVFIHRSLFSNNLDADSVCGLAKPDENDDDARKVNYSANNEEPLRCCCLSSYIPKSLLSFFIKANSTVNAMIFHEPQVKLMITLAWETNIFSTIASRAL